MQVKTFFKKLPFINFLVILLGLFLIVLHVFKKNKNIEAFTQEEKFILKKNSTLYDDFYVNIYDTLLYDPIKKTYEVTNIIGHSKMDKKSIVLDIGSGIGHHINELNNRGINTIGLETSKAMIKKCKSKFNSMNLDIKYGNAMDSMIFETDQFTHILCLFYTFYYMPSQEDFLRNCNKWLRFNGYLVVHIVDREMFHPIVPPSEIFSIPTQVLAKDNKRITESIVKFKGFDYKSNFKQNGDKALFTEIFTDTASGNIRKNIHNLTIYTKEDYEKMFTAAGFKIKSIIDLDNVRYHYQHLYVLQKVK